MSRNSSFSYKGKPIDVRRVGSELGVRYVLEGSVQKGGNRVRITARLTDAADGHHVWAERYERALEDIFAVQDEMTHSIIGAIAPGILAAEIERAQRKASTELDQWERMMRAHWQIRRFTRDGSHEAIRLLEEVVARQPDNALAFADLALAHHFAHGHGWAKSPTEAIARRGEAARRAVAADDQDAVAHSALGLHELFMNQHSDALRHLHYAIELDPNSSFAHGMLGVAYCFSGECDPAIQHAQEAMRLSPRDFLMTAWFLAHAWAYLSVENYEKAANSAKRSIECNPAFPDSYAVLAASSAYLGRVEDARSALLEFKRLKPGLTLSDDRLNRPFRRREDRERFLEGLRKSGLPD